MAEFLERIGIDFIAIEQIAFERLWFRKQTQFECKLLQ